MEAGNLLIFTVALFCIFAVGFSFDVSHCDTGNTSVYGYEVLPGNGWDNLKNEVRGRIVLHNFTSCQVTEDGRYLIPDGVFAIPLKSSQVDLFSQIIDNWANYTSDTAASINLDGSITIDDLPLNGKFSAEFQNVKGHQINENAATLKVKARYVRYTAKLQPLTSLDPIFMKRVTSIAQHIQFNRTASAAYESQLLVRDFGTHVVTSVDAGASIVKTDHIQRGFVENSTVSRYQISLASADIFNLNGGLQVDPTIQSLYYSSLTHSSISTYGGPIFKPLNFSINDWVDGIGNDLVAIDRAGDPLHFLIRPILFPDIPTSTVYELTTYIDKAIKSYYKYNTHKGCTDRNSPNFNYQANIDDGSCSHNITGLVFGGTFQRCNESGQVSNTCGQFESKNPLTGDFSCPEGFEQVPLFSSQQQFTQVNKVCEKYMIFWTKCHNEAKVGTASYTSYWCAARGTFEIPTGYLFGGVYTDNIVNTVTNQMACPPYFNPIKTARDLHICVTDDFENGERYALPFAGFYSCQTGNPLNSGFDTSNNSTKTCPPGYSAHLAALEDECDLMYCVRPLKIPASTIVPVRRPPFMRKPLETNTTSEFLVSDNGQEWTQLYSVDATFTGFNGTVSGWIVNDGTQLNMQTLLASKNKNQNQMSQKSVNDHPHPNDVDLLREPSPKHKRLSDHPVDYAFVVGSSIGATLFCVFFTTLLIAVLLRAKRQNKTYSRFDNEEFNHVTVKS